MWGFCWLICTLYVYSSDILWIRQQIDKEKKSRHNEWNAYPSNLMFALVKYFVLNRKIIFITFLADKCRHFLEKRHILWVFPSLCRLWRAQSGFVILNAQAALFTLCQTLAKLVYIQIKLQCMLPNETVTKKSEHIAWAFFSRLRVDQVVSYQVQFIYWYMWGKACL